MKNSSLKIGILFFVLITAASSVLAGFGSGGSGPVLIEPDIFELIAIGTLGMVLFHLKSRNKS